MSLLICMRASSRLILLVGVFSHSVASGFSPWRSAPFPCLPCTVPSPLTDGQPQHVALGGIFMCRLCKACTSTVNSFGPLINEQRMKNVKWAGRKAMSSRFLNFSMRAGKDTYSCHRTEEMKRKLNVLLLYVRHEYRDTLTRKEIRDTTNILQSSLITITPTRTRTTAVLEVLGNKIKVVWASSC